MINPLAVVIAYLKAVQPGGVTQIASKHRFGDTWSMGSRGLVVVADGGDPELYIPVRRVRLEVRAYGNDQYDSLTVLDSLLALTRSVNRIEVTIPGGTKALLYSLLPDSEVSLIFDDELGRDAALLFLTASVSEINL